MGRYQSPTIHIIGQNLYSEDFVIICGDFRNPKILWTIPVSSELSLYHIRTCPLSPTIISQEGVYKYLKSVPQRVIVIYEKIMHKWFKKWAKKMSLENHHLIEAVGNLEKGLSAANLGSNLFKVRVNREEQGKSSGFRTIIS